VPAPLTPRPWQVALPLLLGLLGALWQARRERVTFLTMLSLFLFATVAMIVFLNFSDNEVRDRDYFFTTGYHAYAMWMGLGLVALAGWIGGSFPAGRQRQVATGVAVALLALQPALVAKNLWYCSDASRNTVARDYAWNMLAPLAPNSFVFTNGDNDTYPLWYIQQVEGFRKDVRVVCLALLQTDWYIAQLRDDEPRVPMHLSDDEIRALGMGWLRDEAGNVMATNTFMVHHILEEAKRDGGWSQQPYFAVTAPDHRGYDRFLSLEGMVYRVERDTLHDPMDVPAMEQNLYHRFRYDGLFRPDGSWDRSVYKDESALLLTRNYASAHAQLAMRYHARRDLPRAIAEMERVQRMFPDFASALVFLGQYYLEGGDTTRAVALLRELVQRRPNDPQAHFYYGVTLGFRGDVAGALREYDEAIRLEPDFPDPYYYAYSLLGRAGQVERAVGYLQRLVQVNPQERDAQELLRQIAARYGIVGGLGGAPSGLPSPAPQP